MARKQARDATMQLIYEWSMGGCGEETFEELLDAKRFTEEDREYVFAILNGVKENIENIDKLISDNAIDWKIERMPKIDLSILRFAVYELTIDKSVPDTIVINEAVRLAKKYSSDKSISFINGLLASVLKKEELSDA